MISTNPNRLLNGASLCVVLSAFTLLIYLGQQVLFPLMMAFFLFILLLPVMLFFNRRLRVPHALSALLTMVLAILVVLGVFFFMGRQITALTDDIPAIRQNFLAHIARLQDWISDEFNISHSRQADFIQDRMNGRQILGGSAISTFTDTLLNVALVPVYTFLMLLYRRLFFHFFTRLIPPERHDMLRNILRDMKAVVRSFITGLLIELIVVAILTSVGLWIVGVNYFVFLGLMTAILNLVPYLGILTAAVISVIVAMGGSTELGDVIGVIVVNVVVQLIDNNLLVPKIIGSKVSINALVSIVAVIVGGALAGIAGMFMALPLVAIAKVVFDRIEPLKPWGYLLGDDMPKAFSWEEPPPPDPDVADHINDNPPS